MADRPEIHTRRTRRVRLGAAALAVALVASIVGAATASAGYNSGVKYVHFGNGAQACFAGQALPCTAGAGSGVSNTLYVSQSDVDGEHRYTSVTGTADDPTRAWLAVTLAAGCRSLFRIEAAHLELGHSSWEGWNDPDEAGSWSHRFAGRDVAAGSKTMSERHLAVNVPVEEVVGEILGDDVGDLLDRGEQFVADDVAAGVDPEIARRTSHAETLEIPMHAEVTCRRDSLFGLFDLREMHDPATVPVRIVWLGIGAEPGEEWTGDWRDAELPTPDPVPTPPVPRPEVDDLTSDPWVVQAHLSVLSDPADPCRLLLSGVLVTNGQTGVTYRFVDGFGNRSRTWTVDVDQTFTAFLDHHVDLDTVPADPAFEPGLVAPEADGIGGLTAAPTDRVQGVYRLEVLSPNPLLSDPAGYNVLTCVAEPAPQPEATSTTTSTTTTTVPPGPGAGAPGGLVVPTTTVPDPPAPSRVGGLASR